jgi:hypothetical protein
LTLEIGAEEMESVSRSMVECTDALNTGTGEGAGKSATSSSSSSSSSSSPPISLWSPRIGEWSTSLDSPITKTKQKKKKNQPHTHVLKISEFLDKRKKTKNKKTPNRLMQSLTCSLGERADKDRSLCEDQVMFRRTEAHRLLLLGMRHYAIKLTVNKLLLGKMGKGKLVFKFDIYATKQHYLLHYGLRVEQTASE